MGGFFGGGRQMREVVTQQISPAQEEAIRALLPIQLQEAQLQVGLTRRGAEQLPAALEEVGRGLAGALQASPAEAALPGITEARTAPLAGILGLGAADLLSPVPRAVISPLEEAFRETISPEIQSAAIRAGAPGGSAEQNLFARATREFARGAASQLLSQQAERAKVAGLLAPQAATLGLAGPREAAQLGALERTLAAQREEIPLASALQLLSAGAGIPIVQVPFAPPSQARRSTETPTFGAELGSAFGTALMLALALAAL
jgi:hypothetical protein